MAGSARWTRAAFAAVLGLFAGGGLACRAWALDAVQITPASPPSVKQGTTFLFKANAAGVWSCSGTDQARAAIACKGHIDPTTGVYTAPPAVTAQQSVGGYQLLPNNHIFNTRIDGFPLSPNSTKWVTATGKQNIKYYEVGKPLNYTDAATPTQKMTFYYTPPNDGLFQVPAFPGVFPYEARIEDGWLGARTHQNSDHHLLTVDTANGQLQDMYQWYAVGLNSACPTCNSDSGIKYSVGSFALPANAAADAAGMQMTPLILRLQEMQQAIATGGEIGHALRFTLNQGYCASGFAWPATTLATDGGFVPFGTRFRLKADYDISGFSPIARILLTQLKHYGIILADGGTGYSIDTEDTKWPTAIMNAFLEISSSSAISNQNLEIVSEAPYEVAHNSGECACNRETITFKRTADGAKASVDVVLTGVAVNFPYSTNLVQIQVGAPPYQLTALSNIGGVKWSMSQAVGTLSSTGLYTPPASLGAQKTVTVTATSTVNPAVAASLTLNVFPAGPIRLVPGSAPSATYYWGMTPTPYKDSHGDTWLSIGDDGGAVNNPGAAITGTADPALYANEYSHYQGGSNDERFDFIVPNGSYTITFLGASTSGGAGSLIQDLELNGKVVYPKLDLYAAAGGANKAWNWSTTVDVTNNHLSFVQRIVNNNGTNLGALEIAP